MVQEIEQWLRRHQVFTEPAYLGETAILLGQQFILSPYLVIYRIEAKQLKLCSKSSAWGRHWSRFLLKYSGH